MDRTFNFSSGKLYIKKRSAQELFVFVVFLWPFLIGLTEQIFRLPGAVRFTIDAILILLGIVFISNRFIYMNDRLRPFACCVVIFFAYVVVAHFFNYSSVFYLLWGLRNNFRFYLAFFAFVFYVKEREAERWLGILDVIFWINFAVSLFQFLVLDIKQDELGGIFGSTGGTNGYTLMFFTIVVTRSLLRAFSGQEKMKYCMLKCIASLLVAAMAELKFFYIIFVFLMLFTTVLTEFTWKKFFLILVCAVGVYLGSLLLSYFFSGFEGFLTIEKIIEVATKENYSTKNDINRLSAISTLSDSIVSEPHRKLFGLGLGNCDVSDFPLFNSQFYQANSYLHYTWFSSAMLFLETGYVGLFIYLAFFAAIFMYSVKQLRNKTGNVIFCKMAAIMAVVCVILVFYNSSMRIESAYMAYFILALPLMKRSAESGDKTLVSTAKAEDIE